MYAIASPIDLKKKVQLPYLKHKTYSHMKNKNKSKEIYIHRKKSHMQTKIKCKNIYESESIHKRENHIFPKSLKYE